MQLAIVAAGFTPGEADRLRRSMAAWRRKGGLENFEQRLVDGMARARLRRSVRAADLPADPGLRRIRLSGIALGVVRAARLRLVVAEALRAGGVLRRAAQLAADGLLRAGATRRRRAPAWRRRAAAGRDGERVGLHAREMGSELFRQESDAETTPTPCPVSDRSSLRLGCASADSPKPARNASSPRGASTPFASVADLAHRARLDRRDLARARRRRCARIARRPSARRRVGRRRRRAAAGAARRRTNSTKPTRIAAADRRPGHRRRLPPPWPHAAPASAGAAAPAIARAPARDGRRDHARAARPARAHRRHRHRPAATRHGERRRVRHARGRNRRD